MSTPSSIYSPSLIESERKARPKRSMKKAYIIAIGLAFLFELALALTVSPTGRDMLNQLGVKHETPLSAAE